MRTLYFAEFQLRLLLCKPQESRDLRDGSRTLLWRCGCLAAQVSPHRYELAACEEHFTIFSVVAERDEALNSMNRYLTSMGAPRAVSSLGLKKS